METIKLEINFNAVQNAWLNLNKRDTNFMNLRGFPCIWLQQSGAPCLLGMLSMKGGWICVALRLKSIL